MTHATIHEAKTHLSKLIRKALDGEEGIIAKRHKPLVRLEPVTASGKPGHRPLGWAAGVGFYMAEDFDEPLEDFEEYTYSDAELAQRRAKTESAIEGST
jgi:antitoxin (DNA-binding transcriptional repressor) of toxin-antitoxin stability system